MLLSVMHQLFCEVPMDILSNSEVAVSFEWVTAYGHVPALLLPLLTFVRKIWVTHKLSNDYGMAS